ncbi:MAG: Rz1 family lipoprotein [Rhodospirillales bacterium]
MPNGPDERFEIGLVMAGAISAGAYTAGVIDFLVQALDEWQRAKDDGAPDVPSHDTVIKVMTGASAGGITAAIATAAFGGDIEAIEASPAGGTGNKLYESWVRRIDIKSLLEARDIAADDAVVSSVLDSSELDVIASDAIKVAPTGRARPYVADPLHVVLSVANLRGVPYAIAGGPIQAFAYQMSAHADYMHFTASAEGRTVPGTLSLDWLDYGKPEWQVLKDSALASGAFPVGLKPRLLHRPASDYDLRTWTIPLAPDATATPPVQCCEERPIPPIWPMQIAQNPAGHDYRFLCVDGGLMNNEPLELARVLLAGPDGRNPRRGRDAKRAVLMIDPFPNIVPFGLDYTPKDDILNVIKGMFGSLKMQARFKPDELVLAAADDIYSRFMIAPQRKAADGLPSAFPMASNALGGFGGFLSQDFRAHDYQLGRRNCQRFLQLHFVLPSEGADKNSLFDRWTDAAKAKYRVVDGGQAYLPIVPLVGRAAQPIPAPVWPSYSEAQLADLAERVKSRIDLVVKRLAKQFVKQSLIRWGVTTAWSFKRGSLVEDVMGSIRANLETVGLMAGTANPSIAGPAEPEDPQRPRE